MFSFLLLHVRNVSTLAAPIDNRKYLGSVYAIFESGPLKTDSKMSPFAENTRMHISGAKLRLLAVLR